MATEPREGTAWIEVIVVDIDDRPVEGASATLDGDPVETGVVIETSAGAHEVRGTPPAGSQLADAVLRPDLAAGRRATLVLTLPPPDSSAIDAADGPWHVTPEPGRLLLAARGGDAAAFIAALRDAGIDAGVGEEWTHRGESADRVVAEVALDRPLDEDPSILATSLDVAERLGLGGGPTLPLRRGQRRVAAVGGRIVVEVVDGATITDVRDLAAAVGMAVERTVGPDERFAVLVGDGIPSFKVLDVSRDLTASALVRSAHPDLHAWAGLDAMNDPLWADLDHLEIIGCTDAWSVPGTPWGGSPDVVLGIIDPQGVRTDHEDLAGLLPNGVPKLADSVDAAAVPVERPFRFVQGSHGTQVAGTATAIAGNALGMAGVAPNCRLLGLRTPGVVSLLDMRDMLVWAAGLEVPPPYRAIGRPLAPADVICCAWGCPLPMVPFLDDALRWVASDGRGGKGTVLVCSVGDNGYERFAPVRTVAAHPLTIAVGASVSHRRGNRIPTADPPPGYDPTRNDVMVDPQEDTRALYSPIGLELDVVAPSTPTFPPDPDLPPIEAIWSLKGVAPWYERDFGGTSHAAPVVAGVAALVLSAAPALTAADVRDIIRTTAVQIDPGAAGDGAWFRVDGLPFSRWYGAGRVDARAAVAAAVLRVPGAAAPDDAIPVGGVVVAGYPGGRTGERCRLYLTPALDRWIEYERDDVLSQFGGGGGLPTHIVLARTARVRQHRRRRAGRRAR